MMRMRALAVVLGTVTAVTGLSTVAQAEELEEYLEKAAEAEYTGREIVVTYWEDETHAGIYEVEQGGGLTMVGGTVSRAMVGAGKIDRLDDGRDPQELFGWSEWRLEDRYSMEPAVAGRRLGRSVSIVSIEESNRLRMRVAFDTETGAPMLTEVFDGDGRLYRLAVMVDFSPEPPDLPEGMLDGSSGYETVGPAAVETLPATAAGYRRADTYAGPDDTVHAFYSDGLFSFSVFEFAGRADTGLFADAPKLRVRDREYRRISDPGSVLVFWRASDATYLLIGALPPDHLRAVLGDLPEPGDRSLLGRIWRGVFG